MSRVSIIASVLVPLVAALAGGVASAASTTIQIDTQDISTQSPRKETVANESSVEVVVTKLTNEVCGLAFKREEQKPLQATANFIAAAVKAITVASVSACDPAVPEPQSFPLSTQIENRLDHLDSQTQDAVRLASSLQQVMVTEGTRASQLMHCRDSTTGQVLADCNNQAAYLASVLALRQLLGDALEKPLPSVDGLETQVAHIQDLLKETQKHSPPPPDKQAFFDWLADVYSRLTCLSARIRFVKDLRDSILKQREQAAKVLQAFERMEIATEKTFKLAPDKNSTLTGELTCKNYFTDSATIRPVPLTILYHGEPRLSLTLGFLYSTLDKRKIGTHAVRIDDTHFDSVVAETRESSQLVPFSFLDIRLSTEDIRRIPVKVGLGLGVGVNNNNGSREVEYFLGPSISVKNIYLHLGLHRGKFAEPGGGFEIGDLVNADKFPGVPVERRDKDDFGIALAYRLPLN